MVIPRRRDLFFMSPEARAVLQLSHQLERRLFLFLGRFETNPSNVASVVNPQRRRRRLEPASAPELGRNPSEGACARSPLVLNGTTVQRNNGLTQAFKGPNTWGDIDGHINSPTSISSSALKTKALRLLNEGKLLLKPNRLLVLKQPVNNRPAFVWSLSGLYWVWWDRPVFPTLRCRIQVGRGNLQNRE